MLIPLGRLIFAFAFGFIQTFHRKKKIISLKISPTFKPMYMYIQIYFDIVKDRSENMILNYD
jgi:hypothetical protein